MNAAALMTADQYRLKAQQMIERSEEVGPPLSAHLRECANVYALLAISAQMAENHAETPF